MHRALSAIRNNGVSAFQREVYTGRIGPIAGTLESVRIIEVSAFQGCPQGGVPLYTSIFQLFVCLFSFAIQANTTAQGTTKLSGI